MSRHSTPYKAPGLADTLRMRRVATGILLAILCVFLATFIVPQPVPEPVLFVRAMAEAGMVGGLADWFAVEALFRRPLGLPIPHTALLPNNQKRAANNIARFIDEHFLIPDRLIAQIRSFDPLRRLSEWLTEPENARAIGRELSWLVRLLVEVQVRHGLPLRAQDLLGRAVRDALEPEEFGDRIAALLQEALETDLLDDVLARVHEVVDQNRPAIGRLVQDRSRWWIASGVDRQFEKLLTDGILSVIEELSDRDSDLRKRFEASAHGLIERFRADGVIAKQVEQGLSGYEGSRAFRSAVTDMVPAVLEALDAKMQSDPEALSEVMSEALQGSAAHMARDDDLLARSEARLEQALRHLLEGIRPHVRDYVSRTIREWDSADLVQRLEAEVGRDLQFIRINGAVLGAFLGGGLFLAERFLADIAM